MPRRIYKTAAWLNFRREHLLLEPLCRACKEAGIIKPGHHVDHIVPIEQGGDPFPGHEGVQSLCAPCHSKKTAKDMGKTPSEFHKGCDANGVPLDPRHPWNKAK